MGVRGLLLAIYLYYLGCDIEMMVEKKHKRRYTGIEIKEYDTSPGSAKNYINNPQDSFRKRLEHHFHQCLSLNNIQN